MTEGIDPVTPEVAGQLTQLVGALMVIGALLLALIGIVYFATLAIRSPRVRTDIWVVAFICALLLAVIGIVGLSLAGLFT